MTFVQITCSNFDSKLLLICQIIKTINKYLFVTFVGDYQIIKNINKYLLVTFVQGHHDLFKFGFETVDDYQIIKNINKYLIVTLCAKLPLLALTWIRNC